MEAVSNFDHPGSWPWRSPSSRAAFQMRVAASEITRRIWRPDWPRKESKLTCWLRISRRLKHSINFISRSSNPFHPGGCFICPGFFVLFGISVRIWSMSNIRRVDTAIISLSMFFQWLAGFFSTGRFLSWRFMSSVLRTGWEKLVCFFYCGFQIPLWCRMSGRDDL